MKEVFVMAKIFTKNKYQLTVQDLIDLLEQIPNKKFQFTVLMVTV